MSCHAFTARIQTLCVLGLSFRDRRQETGDMYSVFYSYFWLYLIGHVQCDLSFLYLAFLCPHTFWEMSSFVFEQLLQLLYISICQIWAYSSISCVKVKITLSSQGYKGCEICHFIGYMNGVGRTICGYVSASVCMRAGVVLMWNCRRTKLISPIKFVEFNWIV